MGLQASVTVRQPRVLPKASSTTAARFWRALQNAASSLGFISRAAKASATPQPRDLPKASTTTAARFSGRCRTPRLAALHFPRRRSRPLRQAGLNAERPGSLVDSSVVKIPDGLAGERHRPAAARLAESILNDGGPVW